MKQLKKLVLLLMCAGVMLSVTACADNADDNGAGQNNDVVNDGANDTENGDSAIDEIGDGLEEGADGVGKGVNDVLDGLDGEENPDDHADNTNRNTVNDATTGNDNVNDR